MLIEIQQLTSESEGCLGFSARAVYYDECRAVSSLSYMTLLVVSVICLGERQKIQDRALLRRSLSVGYIDLQASNYLPHGRRATSNRIAEDH